MSKKFWLIAILACLIPVVTVALPSKRSGIRIDAYQVVHLNGVVREGHMSDTKEAQPQGDFYYLQVDVPVDFDDGEDQYFEQKEIGLAGKNSSIARSIAKYVGQHVSVAGRMSHPTTHPASPYNLDLELESEPTPRR